MPSSQEVHSTPSGILFCVAIAIAIATIAIVTTSFLAMTGAPFELGDEWPTYVFQIFLVFIPFFFLAVSNVRRLIPWFIAAGLTALIWGFVLYVGVSAYGNGQGAYIGLGWLLIVSPFIISGPTIVAARYIS